MLTLSGSLELLSQSEAVEHARILRNVMMYVYTVQVFSVT